MSYFTVFSNTKGATPEMAPSPGPENSSAVTRGGQKWKRWVDGACRVSVLRCQAWISWAETSEGPLSSAGHRGAPGRVTGSWTAQIQPFTQDFPLLSCPGSETQQLSFLLRGPARSWRPAASTIPSSKLPFPPSRATDPQPHLHFVLLSPVTKTRRAAVMDRTGPALAGF